MMEPLIKADCVSYKTGQKYLLHELNWEVNPGENWVVFGLNGSGKTTLLSLIAGYHAPTSGNLKILGQSYDDQNVLQLRQKVGLVSSSFFEKYYARETVLNIVLSGKFGTLGIDYEVEDRDVRQAKAILEELRLKEKIRTTFHLLSKGERQNVLLARALIAHPEIVLLDEPDNGLDIYAREHMQNTIRDLAEDKRIAVIQVTHYPESIQPQFNHCLLMRYGRIYRQGDTKDVFHAENLSELLNESVTVCEEKGGGFEVHLKAPSRLKKLCYGEKGGLFHG